MPGSIPHPVTVTFFQDYYVFSPLDFRRPRKRNWWLGNSWKFSISSPKDPITERQMMIGVYNHLLRKVFRFHETILRRWLDPYGSYTTYVGNREGTPWNECGWRGCAPDFRVSSPRGSRVSSFKWVLWWANDLLILHGMWFKVNDQSIKILILTVDGRNPTPPGMYKTL